MKVGIIVTYCGPESNWQPRPAIQIQGGDVVRHAPAGVPILFNSIRDAVEYARDNSFDYVMMTEEFVCNATPPVGRVIYGDEGAA